jgi:anti-sigma-K factor RskA
MDDELQQLEAELKSLRPAAPTPRLVARIERELAPAARRRQPFDFAQGRPAPLLWFWAAALPAAAALAIVVGSVMRRDLASSRDATQPALADDRAVLKPITAENVLYSATDEGLVTLDDGTRARRERLNYVDTITFKNPRTNASLKWSVPREEIRVVPVSFQ